MALVVFLRGVNVGGHRTFRPRVLARELGAHGVVNVGSAGTFVVRKPGPRAKFQLLEGLSLNSELAPAATRQTESLLVSRLAGTPRPRTTLVHTR